MNLPTVQRLRELLAYNSATGELVNLVSRGGLRAGAVAGTTASNRRVYLSIDGRKLLAHRIAWAIVTGEWPDGPLDHRDLAPGNNRWENLRAATWSKNQANSARRSHSRQPAKGVERRGLGFRARITVDGRRISLGAFTTLEAAAQAYRAAAEAAFGEFARS